MLGVEQLPRRFVMCIRVDVQLVLLFAQNAFFVRLRILCRSFNWDEMRFHWCSSSSPADATSVEPWEDSLMNGMGEEGRRRDGRSRGCYWWSERECSSGWIVCNWNASVDDPEWVDVGLSADSGRMQEIRRSITYVITWCNRGWVVVCGCVHDQSIAEEEQGAVLQFTS